MTRKVRTQQQPCKSARMRGDGVWWAPHARVLVHTMCTRPSACNHRVGERAWARETRGGSWLALQVCMQAYKHALMHTKTGRYVRRLATSHLVGPAATLKIG